MLVERLRKNMGVALIVGASAFLAVGCGGGGGDDGVDAPEPDVTITEANAEKVTIGAAVAALDFGLLNENLPLSRSNSVQSSSTLQKLVYDSVTNVITQKNGSVQTRENIPGFCDEGSADENDGAIVFNQCKIHDEAMGITMTMNGKVTATVDKNGDLTSFTLENFSLDMPNMLSMDVTYAKSTIAYATTSAGQEPNVIDSDMTAKIEVYDSKYADGAPEGKYGMHKLVTHISGEVSGKQVLRANGMILTPCTGGWVEIKTVKDIVAANSDECPTEGEIEIIGAESTKSTLLFKSNGPVELKLNGKVVETYSTCDDMPDGCPAAK